MNQEQLTGIDRTGGTGAGIAGTSHSQNPCCQRQARRLSCRPTNVRESGGERKTVSRQGLEVEGARHPALTSAPPKCNQPACLEIQAKKRSLRNQELGGNIFSDFHV
ncbi:hypothetical protein [Kamptonema formosum]|uniref:hypothetical protein n=1 Tax=Kamptonema formosum TaxID=331992 RepID=UPI000477ABE7|nr:hypothetical protein [Oscillatoria sp. PCC 10802]